MKCQKCGAENIREAVKCGVCGTRLKHVKTYNQRNEHAQVQSSIQPKKTPQQNKKEQQRLREKEISAQTHINVSQPSETTPHQKHILLESLKDKLKNTSSRTAQPKKNRKWIFIIFAIFIFASPILALITQVIVPEIRYQIREHLRIASESIANDEATSVEETATTEEMEVVDNEFKARYYDLQAFQSRLANYYEKKHQFATSLKEIEKFDETQFSDFVFEQIGLTQEGVLVGKFKQFPSRKIYMVPIVENQKITDWECYRVDIDDDLLKDCTLVSSVPYHE